MRILVIGANGFIGSHLVDRLKVMGHQVRAFDRFSTIPTFDVLNIDIRKGDYLNRVDLQNALEDIEVVMHFLSTSTPASADEDPTFDIRTNIVQSVELLDLCVRCGVSKFFYASSGGSIYGSVQAELLKEDMPPIPLSPYAIGKLTIENYLSYFKIKHGLNSCALRISNPFGPRQRQGRAQGLIPIALQRLAAGLPVIRFGSGSMVRDYIYVGDLVDSVARMVCADPMHRIYNLGSGFGHSVSEVLDLIAEITGRSLDIRQVEAPSTFVERSVLDTSRFESEFGRICATSMRDGIAQTWNAIRPQPP